MSVACPNVFGWYPAADASRGCVDEIIWSLLRWVHRFVFKRISVPFFEITRFFSFLRMCDVWLYCVLYCFNLVILTLFVRMTGLSKFCPCDSLCSYIVCSSLLTFTSRSSYSHGWCASMFLIAARCWMGWPIVSVTPLALCHFSFRRLLIFSKASLSPSMALRSLLTLAFVLLEVWSLLGRSILYFESCYRRWLVYAVEG